MFRSLSLVVDRKLKAARMRKEPSAQLVRHRGKAQKKTGIETLVFLSGNVPVHMFEIVEWNGLNNHGFCLLVVKSLNAADRILQKGGADNRKVGFFI